MIGNPKVDFATATRYELYAHGWTKLTVLKSSATGRLTTENFLDKRRPGSLR